MIYWNCHIHQSGIKSLEDHPSMIGVTLRGKVNESIFFGTDMLPVLQEAVKRLENMEALCTGNTTSETIES